MRSNTAVRVVYSERLLMTNSLHNRLFYTVFFGVLVNLFAFLVVSIFIGGMAFNGKQAADAYFLGSGSELIEVSKQTYMYSFWHGISVLATLPIAIIAVLIKSGRE